MMSLGGTGDKATCSIPKLTSLPYRVHVQCIRYIQVGSCTCREKKNWHRAWKNVAPWLPCLPGYFQFACDAEVRPKDTVCYVRVR